MRNIYKIESILNVLVTLIGTGPKEYYIIDRRKTIEKAIFPDNLYNKFGFKNNFYNNNINDFIERLKSVFVNQEK